MSIKVARKIQRIPLPTVEEKPVEKKPEVKELPPDVYEDEIDRKELEIDESNKLVFSVRRGGEFGLPLVEIRHFITTDRFTGFTRKAITFPVDLLLDFSDILREVSDECDEKGLFE